MLKLNIGLCSALVSLCLIMPANAKVSAKEYAEKTMQGMVEKDQNFTYNCQGNDTKASCTAKKLVIHEILSINNIKFDYLIDNKNVNSSMDFDLQFKNLDSVTAEFMPKHISCVSPSKLQDKLYQGQITCDITSPSYSIQIKGAGSMESDRFVGKDSATISEEFEALLDKLDSTEDIQKELQDFKIDPRELVINVKGAQLGNKIFNAIKKEDPSYTREQYIAAINMGVAMVPVGLANAKTSETTMEQITKAATALGDIATSKKQQVTISFKRKSAVMLNLADLPDFIEQIDSDPLSLLKYLDEYQISTISR